MSAYAASELRRQAQRGSYEGEDFFRLQVTGNGKTKWLNITQEQLAAIATLVDEEEESPTYKRIGDSTPIDADRDYAVMATYKDEAVDPFVKIKGTYDECAEYADRNESPDNNERYYVAELVY